MEDKDVISSKELFKRSEWLYHVYIYDNKMKNYYTIIKLLKKQWLTTDSIQVYLVVDN